MPDTLCSAIRFCLTLSNGFDLAPTHCAIARSCHHILGGLTMMADLAACLFARLAAFLHCVTSAVYWRGWPPLATAEFNRVLWTLQRHVVYIRAVSLLQTPTPTPAFSLDGPFKKAFALKHNFRVAFRFTSHFCSKLPWQFRIAVQADSALVFHWEFYPSC